MKPEILIMGDNDLTISPLDKYFTDQGYRVWTTTNNSEGIRMLQKERASIVIADCPIPDPDPCQSCRMIRQAAAPRSVYVIRLTDQSDRDCLVEAVDGGPDDFVSRPVHLPDLLRRIKVAARIIEYQNELASNNRMLHRIADEIQSLNQTLAKVCTTDELTGLLNRREALAHIDEYAAQLLGSDRRLACILLDIDHFRVFNDALGHDVGDLVLREVASTMEGFARADAMVFHLGGDKFLVLCPNTNTQMAASLAEHIRIKIASSAIRYGDIELHASVSAGVAELEPRREEPRELLKKVEQRLHEAKQTGRNRVCLAAFSGDTATQNEASNSVSCVS